MIFDLDHFSCDLPELCLSVGTSSMDDPIASDLWSWWRLWSKNDQPRSEKELAVYRPENSDIFATGGTKDRSTSPSRSRSLFQSPILDPRKWICRHFFSPRARILSTWSGRTSSEFDNELATSRIAPFFLPIHQFIPTVRPSLQSLARVRAPLLPSHYRVLYSPIVA